MVTVSYHYVLAIREIFPMTKRVGKSKRVKIRQSAGILMYDNSRGNGEDLNVLIVHPGGHCLQTRMRDTGVFRRENSTLVKMRLMQP